jgi:hypothetical protein
MVRSAPCDCLWGMEQVLLLDQLGQHPCARFRVDKRNPPTMRADARRHIDQANARRFQISQSCYQIRDGVRDMMHSLATLGQVARDRTVRVRWSNQFDPACSGVKRRHLNRLLGEVEPFASGKTKRLIARQRLIEVGYDNRDMVQHGVDLPRHGLLGTGH